MKVHLALFVAAMMTLGSNVADQKIPELLSQDRTFAALAGDAFDTLGWDLPDGGRHVKAMADAAPGGAFDPGQLEGIGPAELGYRARWRLLRYKYYGLDWTITGLQLTPSKIEPSLPTLAIIHGGSANWYEFFVDPLNRPGIGQFLAQRMPIVLITIPGNYTDGGWTEEKFDARIPGLPIRVLLVDTPVTHYAHIERPKQLAAVLVGAARWVAGRTDRSGSMEWEDRSRRPAPRQRSEWR